MSSNDILSKDLKASEKLVLMALVKYAGKTNKCFPSNSKIAETTGLSIRTITRATNALVVKGYIIKEARKVKKENTSNLYHIIMSIPHDKMAEEVKDLKRIKDKDITSCLPGQIDDTKNDDDVSPISDLKTEIENVVGEEIDHKGLASLILKADKETIKNYLANWHKFNQVQKTNPVGFFIDLCTNKRPIPHKITVNQSIYNNFEQRKYSDEFYNSLYENNKWGG